VAKALFRAEADNHFFVGIESDSEPLEVFRGNFAAEVGDDVRLAVAMVARVAGGLDQFVDDEILGRVRGVAHAQVDHIVAGPPLVVEQRVDPPEQVRRQARDPLGHLHVEEFLRGFGGWHGHGGSVDCSRHFPCAVD
jgi:hypothetical protein